jgi:hypothetical protein
MACKAGHSNYTTVMNPVFASRFGFGRQEATNSAIIFFIGSVQWGQAIEMVVDG